MTIPTGYRAFILRMWTEEDALDAAPEPPWRFSLERIGTQDATAAERRGFASAEELLAYVQKLTRATTTGDKSSVQEAK